MIKYMYKYSGPVMVNNKIRTMRWIEEVGPAESEERAKMILASKFKNKFDSIDDGARIVFLDKCLKKLYQTF